MNQPIEVGIMLVNIGWVDLIWNILELFFVCKFSNILSLNLNRYSLFYQHSVQAWTKSFTIYSTGWKQDRYRICYVLFGFVNCKHNILKQTINFSSFLKRVILKIVQNICEWKLKTIHWLWLVYYIVKLVERKKCITIKNSIPKDCQNNSSINRKVDKNN